MILGNSLPYVYNVFALGRKNTLVCIAKVSREQIAAYYSNVCWIPIEQLMFLYQKITGHREAHLILESLHWIWEEVQHGGDPGGGQKALAFITGNSSEVDFGLTMLSF